MAAFHHGISAQEVVQGILPMRNANVSVIGLVVTSTDADADMYPLDTPVLLTGITQDNIDKSGTTGTLRNCLQTIRDIHNPTLVILRVDAVFDVDLLDILLTCPTRFGLMPKRLGAPEIDTPEVTLKLVNIAKDRRAMVYASPRKADGSLITDKAEIVAYRDTFGDRELCLIDGVWGVPGKSEGSVASGGIVDTPPNFAELPYQPLVKINNEKNGTNNTTAYFAVEINGVIYNADKSQDLLLDSNPLDDQVSFYEPEPGVLGIGALVPENKKVRLMPSEDQKQYSNMFLQGDGLISASGTIAFNIFSDE